MGCQRVELPGGAFAIVCRGRQRSRPCAHCGKPSSFLCDGPGAGGRTCDRPLCAVCAIHVPPGRDFCRAHRAAAADAAAQLRFEGI